MASAQAVQVRTTARTLISPLGLALILALTGASNAQTDEEVSGTEADAGPSAAGPAGEPAQPMEASQTKTSEEETGRRSAPDPDAPAAADAAAQEAAKFAAAIAKGTVLQQMTMEQVIQARGEPDRKEVIPPDAELWHYPSGEVAFSAGKVTYVSLAEKRGKTPSAGSASVEDRRERMSPSPVGAKHAEQVGVPSVRVGDSYIYESFDPAKPSSGLTTRRTVTSAAEGKIVLSSLNLDNPRAKARSLRFNREWNLIASRSPDGSGRDYSPPLMYYDFPLFPGKTWRQTTTETDIKTGAVRFHTVSGVVKGWESVSVPAGTFRGIRVDLETELYDPSTGERVSGTDISWYVPEVRRSVKSDTTGRGGSQRVIRLLSYDVE